MFHFFGPCVLVVLGPRFWNRMQVRKLVGPHRAAFRTGGAGVFFWFSNARGFKVIWRMDPYHGLGWTRMFLGFLGICCRSSLGAFVHFLFLGNDTWHMIERCPIRLFWSFFIPTCPGVYKNTHRIERTVLFRCNLSCYRVYPFTSCLMVDRRMIKSLVEVGHGVPTK